MSTFMTDSKGGKANIKKKKPIPNYSLHESDKEPPAVLQRDFTVKVEVPEYNTKAGKLPL